MKDKDTKLLEEAYKKIIESILYASKLEIGYEPKGRGTPYYIQGISDKSESGPQDIIRLNSIDEVNKELKRIINNVPSWAQQPSIRYSNLSDEDIRVIENVF